MSSLGDEPDISKSLAATIKLAAAKGYIEKDTTQKPVKVSTSSKSRFECPVTRIEEKHQRSHSNFRKNQLIDVKEPEYKPEIKLEYTDDAGQRLETPKEQFRYMCHKFHGKGPGKNKIDKRRRKQQALYKMKASSTSATSATTAALIAKQKELKSPYIILK